MSVRDALSTLREELFAPFPRWVPFVSIYSREDRLVDWRSCQDPDAQNREVCATPGLVCWTAALTTVAEELHRVLQAPDTRPSPTMRIAS